MVRGAGSSRFVVIGLLLLVIGASRGASADPAVPPPAPGTRFGTAFALDPSGYFVTAGNIVAGAGTAKLTLGGRTLPAVVRATDKEKGLALLSVDQSGLEAARLGSYEAEEKPQEVFLLGVSTPPAAIHPVIVSARILPDPREKGAYLIAPYGPVPLSFNGCAVVNAIGQVIGLGGPGMAGAGISSSVPFAGTRALWGLTSHIPSASPVIPGLPMMWNEGEAGVMRLYGNSVALVEFEPGPGKATAPDAAGKGRGAAGLSGTGEFPFGIPEDGLDLVQFDDGRALRCLAGSPDPKTGALPLELDGLSLRVPRNRVLRVLYFRDFDPAAANEDEAVKVAKGLARWKGSWVAIARAEELGRKAADDVRARLADENRSWADRRVVETEHFRMESNLSARRLESFGKLLEDYRLHLGFFLPKGLQIYKVPILIFRDRGSFDAFAAGDVGRIGEYTVGYFAAEDHFTVHLALFDMPGDESETVRVLLHEATHLFLHLANYSDVDDGTFPIWLNEGLAEYHGGAAYLGGAFHEGGIQDERLLWVQEMIAGDRFIPLERLTTMKKGIAFDLDCYAESWAFVHFLMNGRNCTYRGGFKNYVVSGLTPFRDSNFSFEDSLLRLLQGNDFKKVTEEFKQYVKGLRSNRGVAYAKRAAARLEKDEGLQLVHADLQEALRVGSGDPDTLLWASGVLARLPGRAPEAVDLLRKALDIDPLNVTARRALATLLPESEGAAHLRLCDALGR